MTGADVHTLSRDDTALAREWIADCRWADLDDEHVVELPTAAIWRGVARYYHGGVAQFLHDAHHDHACPDALPRRPAPKDTALELVDADVPEHICERVTGLAT